MEPVAELALAVAIDDLEALLPDPASIVSDRDELWDLPSEEVRH